MYSGKQSIRMNPMSTQKEIGSKIKKIREEKKNISQKELANLTNLDATYISKIEAGKKNITIDTLSAICSALGISLKEFFNTDI